MKLLKSVHVDDDAIEGGRLVMERLASGLPARPNGVTGETLTSVVCPGCKIKVSLVDQGRLLSVNYEPKNTSDYCVHGLKGKPKGVYCPVLKPVLDEAHFDFNRSVLRFTQGETGIDINLSGRHMKN